MKKRDDILSGAVLGIIGVAFFAYSFQIKLTTSDVLGSRFFPQVSGILLTVLSAIQIIRALKSKEIKAAATGENQEKKTSPVNLPLLLTTVTLFGYYVLIRIVGFTITSILYLMCASAVLMSAQDLKKKRNVVILIIVSVALPVLLNLVFYEVFHIRLPQGMLFE